MAWGRGRASQQRAEPPQLRPQPSGPPLRPGPQPQQAPLQQPVSAAQVRAAPARPGGRPPPLRQPRSAPAKKGPTPSGRPMPSRKPGAPPPKPPRTPTSVQIDGTALLTLVQYASAESANNCKSVAGSLCGLYSESVVYITNSYPVLSDKAQKELTAIRKGSMYETFVVGWYRSVRKGLFIEAKTIGHQRKTQLDNPGSICLVFDPACIAQGRLALKAFRLSDKLMEYMNGEDLSTIALSKLSLDSRKMIEVLPIQIHNSYLTHALLFDLRGMVDGASRSVGGVLDTASADPSGAAMDKSGGGSNAVGSSDQSNEIASGMLSRSARRLKDKSHESQLLESLRQLTNSIDDFELQTSAFRQHHSKCMRLKKMREAKEEELRERARILESRGKKVKQMDNLSQLYPKDPEPSRLESLTLIGQMNEYNDEFDSSILQGLSKIFVTQGLHSEGPLVP